MPSMAVQRPSPVCMDYFSGNGHVTDGVRSEDEITCLRPVGISRCELTGVLSEAYFRML